MRNAEQDGLSDITGIPSRSRRTPRPVALSIISQLETSGLDAGTFERHELLMEQRRKDEHVE